jgi:hypothetical protein
MRALCGVGLNLLFGLLLLGIMPLDYWTNNHLASIYYTSPRLSCGAIRHTLRALYLSGFIHLGGLGGLFGGWNPNRYEQGEALKPLRRLRILFLGLGIFFGITGPVYLFFLVGVVVGSLIEGPKQIAGYIGESEMYKNLAPLNLLEGTVPYFLFLGCLLVGIGIYLLVLLSMRANPIAKSN